MRKIIGLLILMAMAPAQAETAYVTDRLPLALRAAFTEGSPVVKTIEGGAALEVLERAERYARVRDHQGTEGWIEARFLTNVAPARPQLERTLAELNKTQRELADTQARIKQLEATLAQENARAADLAKSVERTKMQTAAQAAAPKEQSSAMVADQTDFSWGWLVLAFAMLWIGFGAGVVWLRERHRKKLGGMYLRI